MRRQLLGIALTSGVVAACAASALLLRSGAVQADEPEITYVYPANGAVLAEPPVVFQMCFKDPINVKDLPPLDEGDYRMAVVKPDGSPASNNTNFQANGFGLTMRANTAGAPEGEWTWVYRVVDADSDDSLEGEITFVTNAAEGEEVPQSSPSQCLAQGATIQPTAPPEQTDDRPGTTPASGTGGGESSDNDADPSVLEMALLTIGVAAAAAVLGVLGYFFRKRVGYEPHAPSGDSSGDDHH